jgi:hypothetical protein
LNLTTATSRGADSAGSRAFAEFGEAADQALERMGSDGSEEHVIVVTLV